MNFSQNLALTQNDLFLHTVCLAIWAGFLSVSWVEIVFLTHTKKWKLKSWRSSNLDTFWHFCENHYLYMSTKQSAFCHNFWKKITFKTLFLESLLLSSEFISAKFQTIWTWFNFFWLFFSLNKDHSHYIDLQSSNWHSFWIETLFWKLLFGKVYYESKVCFSKIS